MSQTFFCFLFTARIFSYVQEIINGGNLLGSSRTCIYCNILTQSLSYCRQRCQFVVFRRNIHFEIFITPTFFFLVISICLSSMHCSTIRNSKPISWAYVKECPPDLFIQTKFMLAYSCQIPKIPFFYICIATKTTLPPKESYITISPQCWFGSSWLKTKTNDVL